MADQDRKQLLEVVKKRSLIWKRVTLASGKTSDYYIDCRLTTLSGEGIVSAARVIYPIIRGVQLVGGLTMGADPFLGALLYQAHSVGEKLDAFIVRKEAKGHGMQKRIEGPFFEGARVAIVEDVVTSGGSVIQAIDAVEQAGGKVEKIVCLVDRLEGGKENLKARGHELISIFSLNDLGDFSSAGR